MKYLLGVTEKYRVSNENEALKVAFTGYSSNRTFMELKYG